MKARRVKGLEPEAPLADNAERIVRVRLDELTSFMPKALDPDEVVALHDMRIAAKRLRYVLEVTGSCFGPVRLERREDGQGPPGPARRDPRLRRPAARGRGLPRGARAGGRGGRRRVARRPRAHAQPARLRGPRRPPRPSAGAAPRAVRRLPRAVARLRTQRFRCTACLCACPNVHTHRRERDARPDHATGEVDLSSSSLYFNRELSWLEFNARVLELAEDESVPLLERVKFCAITSKNLDEFFMVRVAGLHDQIEAGIETPLQDGRTPSATLDAIREVMRVARRAPEPLPGARAAAGAGTPRHPYRRRRRRRAGGAARARRPLPPADLPGAHAARGRPRPAVPVHLEPVAVARRARARPGHERGDVRAREGPEGDAAALRPDRRRLHVRPARGPDRQAPRPAVPGHGDRRLRRLPGHPRRRLHRLRRGRRPAAGGRGRAAAAALRRRRARRGRAPG